MRMVVPGMVMLGLAGCSGGAGESAANGNAPVANAALQNGAGRAAPAQSMAVLTLEGDGLRMVDAESGRATAIPFGTPEDQTIAMIGTAFGPADTRAPNDECPSGPVRVASWNKGLSANFQDGKFVGWAGPVALKTMSGIGFGSRRAALLRAYDATIEQTSLGTEFSANGIGGVLESDASDAAISDMWAGVSCVAR